MSLRKVLPALIVIAATALGGLIFSAQAVRYVYDDLNRLTEVHFDDSTWIQYTYDGIGNQTGKTYYTEFFSITVTSGSGGSISPSSASVIYGGGQTFSIIPNAGYYVADVKVDGLDQGAITSYTFSNVTAAHSISATFANTYTVTPSAGSGGSISPSTAQTVNYDGTTSFTVTPNTGYSISSVTGCGGNLSGNIFTTGQITCNCTVSAAFAINTYSVTPSAGSGGSISPSTAQTVNYGGTTSFSVTPNTGYAISSVTGCGGSLSGSTYTTGPITGNCTVSATFIQTFTVTPSAGAGGGMSPSTPQTVNSGGTASFTVTPNSGYAVSSVTGCGGTLSGNTYTTGPITGNCTVSATFIQTFTVTPSAGAGGSMSPSTPQTVNSGGTTSFTVTPNTGYGIGSVTGCGGTLSGNTYTTGQITGNCSVSAAFVNYPIVNLNGNKVYTSLQAAYDVASNGDTLLVQNCLLTGSFIAHRGITVTIQGGYTTDFSTQSGMTTVRGIQTISAGTLIWGNFVID